VNCNAMYFGESLKFRINTLSPSSGSKSKPSKKPVEASGTLSELFFETSGCVTTHKIVHFIMNSEYEKMWNSGHSFWGGGLSKTTKSIR
jgi:hypothetical protein